MSERIASARKRIGMPQKELAKLLGIASSTLNGYEKEKHKPDSDVLVKIASITGCTLDYLLGRVDDFDSYYEKEKSPEPNKVDSREEMKMLEDLLVNFGYSQPGQDISDRDAAFLSHWIGLLNAWFEKGS